MIPTIAKTETNSVGFNIFFLRWKGTKLNLNRSTWEICRSSEKISCFSYFESQISVTIIHKSIIFLRDEGGKQAKHANFREGVQFPLNTETQACFLEWKIIFVEMYP